MNYSKQPDFWLEIRKEYIIENFEKLLYYIRRYQYSSNANSGNGEFISTCKHLVRLAEDLSEYSLKSSFIERPEFRLAGSDMAVPEDLAFRIMVAAILASQKTGADNHLILMRLVNLLVIFKKMPYTDICDDLVNVVSNCVRKSPVVSLGLKWDDIENPENFSANRLLHNISQTKFNESAGSDCCGFEGKGTVLFTDTFVMAAPVNKSDFLKGNLSEYLPIGKYLKVLCPKSDHMKAPSCVEDVADGITFMTRAQSGVKSSVAAAKRKYAAGTVFPVLIKSCWGVKIQAESIDPAYEKVAGKVNISVMETLKYVDKHKIMGLIKEGFVLNVEYTPDDNEFMFQLKGGFNAFYEESANRWRGEPIPGIYIGNYSAGTQWLMEDGFVVNVMGTQTDEDVLYAMEQRIPLNIRITGTKKAFGNVLVNGILENTERYDELPEPIDDIESYEFESFSYLFDEYLKYCNEGQPSSEDRSNVESTDGEGVLVVGNILTEHQRRLSDTMPRLCSLQAALMLAICAGDYAVGAYIRHELEYQIAVARFVAGASPMSLSLSHGQNLDGIPEVEKHERIINMIRNYKEPEFGHSHERAATEENVEDTVDGLIDASNRLLGKIDDREISRIKFELAKILDVDDQFKTPDQSTYYGVESDTLEFKTSAVCPPKNKLKGTMEYEPETQKWAILKTVCGFLNSINGGDLLIGVRDNGMAVGISHDYNLLFDDRRIPEANADRYRTYLKNIIDNAFIAYKSRTEKASVTTAYVSYSIEQNNEGVEILRIHVDSYRGDMVRFHHECNRPDDIQEAYIRTSGATVPMNRTIRDQTMLKKYHIAGDREGAGMAAVYEARNSKKRVLLKGYTSKSGVKDREVEVFQVFPESKCIIAYDTAARDVRLFKCSRWKDAIILDKNCTQGSNHKRDLLPDIFGFVFDPEKPFYKVDVDLTDYGAVLLREEYSGAEAVLSATGRTDYPWRLSVQVNTLFGVARFVRGLPSECRVDKDSELAAFLL